MAWNEAPVLRKPPGNGYPYRPNATAPVVDSTRTSARLCFICVISVLLGTLFFERQRLYQIRISRFFLFLHVSRMTPYDFAQNSTTLRVVYPHWQ